ncbi:uncharacterized protein LOC132736286 [Ruditapes philippinarum]|uniref:uncharacterized protein LOC132736286 n=1 Tax=Ruditapes philippinarum TaxID=129788 RepID=UPI00295BF05F|nr:uncharacterized protein LOC132736286 [Ruditapes philippinarum]
MAGCLIYFLIVSTIFTCCLSQNNQNDYDPIAINTPETTRIMNIAAARVGVMLTRQISAFKKRNFALFMVNFDGTHPNGLTLTCNAVVYERNNANAIVTRWSCTF